MRRGAGDPSAGTRCKRGPGRTRERRAGGRGARTGQERGWGSPLPASHSPLEHAGSGTGRSLRCWPGCPRSGASLCPLPSPFFFFLFSYFSLFPPLALRGGAKGDGTAGRLTLALPLRPPPPAAPAGRELLSAGRGRGRGGFRVTPHTFPWGPSPWPAADGTLAHQRPTPARCRVFSTPRTAPTLGCVSPAP